MAESIFKFHCPCCGKSIEVDTRSGKARAANAEEAKGGRDLDTLFRTHKGEQQRLDDLFRTAKNDQTQEKEILDKKLARAKEDAKKDKDTRPRNPFDLE